MAKVPSRVIEDTLVVMQDAHEVGITVGSAEWHDFLNGACTFVFQSASGSFTARKERAQRGSWYWRAYRKRDGKLRRAYLGKGCVLTSDRLREVARNLAEPDQQPSQPRRCRRSAVSERNTPPTGAVPALSVTSTATARLAVHTAPQVHQHSPHPILPTRPILPPHPIHDDSLLVTKITVPALRSDLVARKHLTQRLSERDDSRLILLSAPAGFGKTTLLAEWIAQQRQAAAWLSLDAGDNDPVRFWRYVIAALEVIRPGVGADARMLLRRGQATRLEGVITALVNAVASCGADVVLVLDDYHLITEQAIHDGVRYLLDHLPSSLRVLIASRTDPPLSLARMQARDQMTVLRATDLRFAREEVGAFFAERMQVTLPAKAIVLLEAHTEGWVAALQLIGVALCAQQDSLGLAPNLAHLVDVATSGDQRSLVDFLVEEVLSKQPQDVQTFLLQTAILDRLSGPLCDAVTGRTGADAMLERLERANLFLLPLDELHHWYRYHHLFAEILRARLRRAHPEQMTTLHQRAARWYEEHGFSAEAIHYALAAADFGRAARLIECAAPALEACDELSTLLRWLEQLPEDRVRSRPQLCLTYARALVHTSQIEAAQARLRTAEEILSAQALLDGNHARQCEASVYMDGVDAPLAHPEHGEVLNTSKLSDMLGEVWLLRGALADVRGEHQAAQASYQHARALVSQANLPLRLKIEIELATEAYVLGDIMGGIAAFRAARDLSRAAGFVPGTLEALHGLGTLQLTHAQLRDAAANFKEALHLGTGLGTGLGTQHEGSDSLPLLSLTHMSYGQVLYEWNELEQAASQFRAGLALNERSGDLGLWIRCQIGLARALHTSGKVDEAQALLDHLEHFARTTATSDHSLAALAWAVCVPLWVTQGAVDKIAWWLDECGLTLDEIPETIGYSLEARYIYLAQALLVQGRLDDVLSLLGRLRTFFVAADRRHRVVRVLALQALALHAQGQNAQALATLAEALAVGEPGGYIRTFLDDGAPMLALLAKLARGGRKRRDDACPLPSRDYVRRLLVAGEYLQAPAGADQVSLRRATDALLLIPTRVSKASNRSGSSSCG